MSVTEEKCDVCGEELSVDNYYYVSAGRLQQGWNSDPKSHTDYKLCGNCNARVKAELMASVQKYKTKSQEEKKQ